MATHDDNVLIEVVGDAPPVTAAGFGIALIADDAGMSERVRAYASAAAAAADVGGSGITAAQAEAISAVFSQTKKPALVLAGRVAPEVSQVTTLTVGGTAATGNYTFKATHEDGTEATVTFAAVVPTDDNDDVGAGLRAAAVTALEPLGITVTGATVEVILTSVAGESFTVSDVATPVGGTLVPVTGTPAVSLKTELAAVLAENSTWYGLALVSRSAVAIRHAAEWVEANRRIFAAQSSDADILTSVTTDIFSELKAAGYNRTFPVYHHADGQHAAFAWMARCLSINMDTTATTWNNINMVGMTVSPMSATAKGYARGKNVNLYLPFYGRPVISRGRAASGRWTDTQVLLDWTESRVGEAIAQLLINEAEAGRKVPYTDTGFSQIGDAVLGVLLRGLNIGHFRLSDSGLPPYVDMPTLAELSDTDKLNRFLPFTFGACEAGSVVQVEGDGFVTVDDSGFNTLALAATNEEV